MRRIFSPSLTLRAVAFALALAVLITGLLVATAPVLFARSVAEIPSSGVISGPARVVDGDTIEIGITRIRLEGIDAPEAGQTCQDRNQRDWKCGEASTKLLTILTAHRDVTCTSRGRDKYGRLLGICAVSGVADINAHMVEQGLAWAFIKYSTIYVEHEARAKQAQRGIWQGQAQTAWDYRRIRWSQTAEVSPQGCAIKGNVSRAGLIYHMPWSPWYEQVVMRPEKGTRWFCSESEAQAAGWRSASAR
jgi:endonuclease YncB( thermonuclease family)